MNEHMGAIMKKAREKQRLEEAARRLRQEKRNQLSIKLSLSAVCGLLIALLPAAGAAQAIRILL